MCAIWLANELGFARVDELLDAMSPEEFNERYAYYLITGAGEARHNVAVLASEIFNLIPRYVMSRTGKKQTTATVADYLPQALKPAKTDTAIKLDSEQSGEAVADAFGFR